MSAEIAPDVVLTVSMAVNGATEINTAMYPKFKATLFDIVQYKNNQPEAWFFLDPIGEKPSTDVMFEAVFRQDGTVAYGVMGADWMDIGSDATVARKVFENWDSNIDIDLQIAKAKAK